MYYSGFCLFGLGILRSSGDFDLNTIVSLIFYSWILYTHREIHILL